ncbi:3-oxoacyl-ACP reductase [Nitratireductor aestuarii]|uniref:3-oxoacyl-ACP reductase n=1 Tax=Nitratireductor aestuarii TaxID=1735103 RepID=A0A916S5A6_9HYPH|nr:SDR family oxidoreductase [Nitratireductor aestuarii]GGA81264.1 3-oxoacyl-ACP reductase [Nitratireductor aestuarii]
MPELGSIAGKTILVTGGSSGLGLHFAQTLSRNGAEVILAARRLDAVKDAAEQLRAEGGKATAVRMDVTNPDSVAEALEGLTLDGLVNNAGVTTTTPAMDISAEDFGSVIDTNLKGVFTVAQAAARNMKGRGGSIVNIASILGLRVAGALSAYAASKAGVVQLTKALALEWARYDIRVNALCPGYIETPLNRDFFATPAGEALVRRIPQRKLGQLSDLDGPLLLLLSDASRYMTGSVIAVDGGHLVSSL